MITEDEARFWSYALKSQHCWLWTRGGSQGYGYHRFKGRVQPAHRISYVLTKGAIPEGGDWTVHHTCFVRRCIRPEHLVLRTRRENSTEAYLRCLKPWQDERRLAKSLSSVRPSVEPPRAAGCDTPGLVAPDRQKLTIIATKYEAVR